MRHTARSSSRWVHALFGLAAATTSLGVDSEAVAPVVVDHRFQVEPWNGAGVPALENLRGRPVLVEFWGTR